MTQTRPLSTGLIELLSRPVSEADRQRATLHVMDWLGCIAAGARTPIGEAFLRYARAVPSGPCPTVGEFRLNASDAAFVNGAMGNILEMDDFYRSALVHPGPVVIPAALAMAVALDVSGNAFLDAVVRGYEAMIRIGCSVGAAHYQYFHNTSTCGIFGATVAAGGLMQLSPSQMRDALGQAGTQASGLWQCRIEETMSKQLHTARAAQAGVQSALLAACGVTGASFIFEGELGFFNALCPDADPARLLAEPDAPWRLHSSSFKPWPACRHTHPTIDAALAVRHKFQPRDIESIEVRTYSDAVAICDKPRPRLPIDAKFSLQHSAAVSLLYGPPALEHFEPASIDDPHVTELRGKITVIECNDCTAAYPSHFGSRVSVTLADGATHAHTINDALGDPENPLQLGQLRDKCISLLRYSGLSKEESETRCTHAQNIGSQPRVLAFAKLLHSTAAIQSKESGQFGRSGETQFARH